MGFGVVVLYAVLALAAVGTVAGIGFKIRHDGYSQGAADVQAKWDRANREQRELEARQAAEAEAAKEKEDAKRKVVYRTITKTVDKYIDRPVYRNVCFDADGLRDANAALSGALTPAAEPDRSLPAAHGP